jgi:hypothetical protein
MEGKFVYNGSQLRTNNSSALPAFRRAAFPQDWARQPLGRKIAARAASAARKEKMNTAKFF